MEKKNNLDPQYNNLLGDILENGIKKQTRNGEVLSLFGKQIRHKMSEGFPLLTGKKMFFKGIVTELLWFLRGDTNIKFLVDNDCHIWDGDAYQAYKKEINRRLENWVDIQEGDIYDGTSLDDSGRIWTQEEFINKIKTDDEFAKKWGELGPIYGKQWRSCSTRKLMFRSDVVGEPQSLPEFFEVNSPIDQIENLINDLKTNPDSRRLMVSAWNVGELDQMVLPPCHYGFQVYTRELNREERVDLYIKKYGDTGMDYQKYKDTIPTRAISLMWNQRSVDFGLGAPFNIASYGLLLEIIAKEVNMIPDELIGNLGDVHLYLDHVEPIKEQLNRDPFILPKLKIKDKQINDISQYNVSDFELIGYQSHPTIKLPLSN
jgi:thymidylate synthase